MKLDEPLSLSTLYLGDGCRDRKSFMCERSGVRAREITLPKEKVVPRIIEEAYRCGYGLLLDLLKSLRWEALKNLVKKPDRTKRVRRGALQCAYLPI